MAIIRDGKVNAVREAIYSPGALTTGDLVPGAPLVIAAVAEAAGLGAADFAVPITLATPADARFTVLSVALQLTVNFTVDDGNDLRVRVYVDDQLPANLIFDRLINAPAPVLDATGTSWLITTFIGGLISDGLPHTYYFYLWKTGAGVGNQIDQLELWLGVGSEIAAGLTEVLTFDGIRGFTTVSGLFSVQGPGGAGVDILTVINSPKGGVLGEDVLAIGPSDYQPLSLVEGGGNWFNARPVHTVGSIGVSMLPDGIEEIGVIEYIRLIWSESE